MSDRQSGAVPDGVQNSAEDEDGPSRRSVLVGGGLAALGLGVGAFLLTDEEDTPEESPAGDEPSESEEADNRIPFSIWEQIQAGLRESPDHLPGTAERLAADGDAQAIFEFVRDEFVVHPPSIDSLADGGFPTRVNGGPRGLLRSGTGTPREQADLLAALLDRAGYESEVVSYGQSPSEAQLRDLFFDPVDREFDPGFDGDQLAEWQGTIAAESDATGDAPSMSGIDRDGEESAALADRLRSALPEGFEDDDRRGFNWDQPGRVPVVRFRDGPGGQATGDEQATTENSATTTAIDDDPTEAETTAPASAATGTPEPDDGWRYADLFNPEESFGTLSEPGQIASAPAASAPGVSVTLEAAFSDAPAERRTLVSGQWDGREVAGRQLLIETLPGLSPFDSPNIRYTDVNRFVPALGVHDPHAADAELDALTVVGEAFSVTGDRYTVDDTGTIRRNRTVVEEGGDSRVVVEAADGTQTTVTPIQSDQSVRSYYGIGASQSEVADALELPNTTVSFLYRNGKNGRLSLVTIQDIPGDNGSGSARMTFEGARGAEWLIADGGNDTFESREGPVGDSETVTWGWKSSFNDGGALGPLTLPFEIGITHEGMWDDGQRQNLDRWVFVNGDAIDEPFELATFDTDDPEDVTVSLRSEPPEEAAEDGQGTAPTLSEDVDAVEQLDVTASAGGYPRIRVDVDPLDATGESVEGLSGEAFEIAESAEGVGAEMLSNRFEPRVLVAYDSNISSNFYGESDDFRRSMTTDVQEFYPDARVSFTEVSADAWLHVSDRSVTEADLIVYVADSAGTSTDSRTDARVTAVEAGPPAVILSPDGENGDGATEIADISGGRVIATEDNARIRSEFVDFVEDLDDRRRPYTFTYRSPNPREVGAERSVSASITGGSVSSNATYEVPDASLDPRASTAVCGLYLTVRIGGRTSRRTLAGWDPELDDGTEPTDEHRLEAHSALFGNHVLSFESAGVSPTVFLEEELAGKLSLESIVGAGESGSHEEVKEAIRGGTGAVEQYPQHFQPMLPDRVTEASLTYGIGLRTVLFGRTPEFGSDEVELSIDILSTADIRTLRDDGDRQREFEQTMARTARRAIVERENLDTSTSTLLGEATLTPASEAPLAWAEGTRTQFETARTRRAIEEDYQLVDEAGETAAFWNVERRTGAVVGVLPDGSGGGDRVEEIKETLEEINQLANAMGLFVDTVGMAAGVGATGVVVDYYQLLAKLYAFASIAIATMDASQLGEQARQAIAKFACNLVLDMALDWAGGPLVDTITTASDVSGAMGGDTIGC